MYSYIPSLPPFILYIEPRQTTLSSKIETKHPPDQKGYHEHHRYCQSQGERSLRGPVRCCARALRALRTLDAACSTKPAPPLPPPNPRASMSSARSPLPAARAYGLWRVGTAPVGGQLLWGGAAPGDGGQVASLMFHIHISHLTQTPHAPAGYHKHNQWRQRRCQSLSVRSDAASLPRPSRPTRQWRSRAQSPRSLR